MSFDSDYGSRLFVFTISGRTNPCLKRSPPLSCCDIFETGRDTLLSSVEKLLKDDIRLPSPPAIAVRILDLVKKNNFSFRQLAKIIHSDPALASRILRLANSSCYGMPKNVSNFETAVALLGGDALKNIALSFIIAQGFQGKKGGRFDFDILWRRAVTSAVAGQLLAAEVGLKSDDVFITALLQDIGIGAMFLLRENEYLAVLDERAVSGRALSAVEKEFFDCDHPEVGAALLEKWGLPESVYVPIRYHHDPEKAPLELQPLCRVIQASDRLSAVYYGSGCVRNVRIAKQLLMETFQLDEARSMRLIDAVVHESDEVLAQFEIQGETPLSYSQLLEKANDELRRLNISSQMLVVEYREAKKRADQLAAELQTANTKLREAAFRDNLSGLYNHRFFYESHVGELESSKRNSTPVSVILFDVDNFKAINDSYGHQTGDMALQMIGDYLLRTSRAADIPARLGGDEFAILLRNTPLEGARIRAKSICDEVGAIPVTCKGVNIGITVSVGVASDIQRGPITKSRLIDLADKALYESKNTGRNRVTIQKESACTSNA